MVTIETYELRFRRMLDQALAAHGRRGASPAQVARCCKAGLSVGEAACIIAPHQERLDSRSVGRIECR